MCPVCLWLIPSHQLNPAVKQAWEPQSVAAHLAAAFGRGAHRALHIFAVCCLPFAVVYAPGTPSASATPASTRSASALSVRSHGASMSSRPKWPYAAVAR